MWMDTTTSWRSSQLRFLTTLEESLATISPSILNTQNASMLTYPLQFWCHCPHHSFRISKHRFGACLPLHTRSLAHSLADYSDYLSSQNKVMKNLHTQSVPVRQLPSALSAKHIPASASVPLGKFTPLTAALAAVKDFDHLFLNDFLPALPKPRYEYIQYLERNGLPSPLVLLTYSSGNNAGILHFVWKVPTASPAAEYFNNSLTTIEGVKPLLPQFHTRAMRQVMFENFGRVSPNIKPAVLRLF